MTNLVVLGTQWGDEGKGKMVDTLAQNKKFACVVRYQGGNNAGHTVVVKGEKHAFHLLPSGILHPDKTCVIGNGVIVNPEVLLGEVERLEKRVGKKHAKLLVSEKVHLIMPWHMVRDALAGGKIGTTGRGIGPTYTDYINRRGIRFLDTQSKKRFSQRIEQELIWNKKLIKAMFSYFKVSKKKAAKFKLNTVLNKENIVKNYWRWLSVLKNNPLFSVGDVSLYFHNLQNKGKSILFEGAQATLLDIAHGTYPYVTSSNPTVGGVYTGTGFCPKDLQVYGVAKAYTTRVGAGPFPTELFDKVGKKMRKIGHEFGTTTGRPRRCGWLDLTILQYANMINGLDALVIPKLDVLSGINPLKIAVSYQIGKEKTNIFTIDEEKLKKAKVVYKEVEGWEEDITKVRKFEKLPKAAKKYISTIERIIKTPVKLIGVGPGRAEIIKK
ncbi:adenylosuccinate synthase [Patescibacteria group bacterium]